ncbi:MAG: S1 RNA-binding domain-containing protein [Phycisphaeraceae bacterium]|nr:MAG: S1 RNA-binding domain-containing protein [Phycisphaeraceae bacterium]
MSAAPQDRSSDAAQAPANHSETNSDSESNAPRNAESPPDEGGSTPTAKPAAAPAPASESPPAIPSDMSREMDREMEKAMQGEDASAPTPTPGANGGPSTDASPGAPDTSSSPAPVTDPGARRPAIRGPRVVQAGREHRSGRVVSVGPSDIFIEFGPKELGVAQRTQWPDDELPKVDETVQVVVDRFEPNEQIYICSRPGAVQKAQWELLEPGQIVEARVTGVNKGGLELEVANHRAFMPAGRVDVRHIEDLSVFVGEKLKCRVAKVDRSGRGNIVLSRRELIAAEMKELKEQLKGKLKEGQTVEGVVRKIMPFGAFVDIGGVDGLVHISDLSHDRVHNVEKVVKEGDTVTVKILKLEWEKDRISLGMKQAQPDPFATAAEEVAAGAEITGRVTKLLEFGVFVELSPGVEGLIHISELAWRRVGQASEIVQVDEVITVKVLEVDPDRRRISLSLKQMTQAPAPKGGGRKGRGEESRSEEEIRKETPAQRRMREQFQAKQKAKGEQGLKSGLGEVEGVGLEGLASQIKLG